MAEVRALLSSVASSDPPLHARLALALDAVRRALHVFGRARELVFSFNGGKDSTAVLHLLRLALLLRAEQEGGGRDEGRGGGLGGVRLVYFEAPRNFPEVLEFMHDAAAALAVEVDTIRGGFKVGLEQLLREGARCVLMGTRRADPDGGALEIFSPTSLSWPPLMRCCPALHLEYADVWRLLRGAGLPFCSLYAAGYSSLGSVDDSLPNPALRVLPAADEVAEAAPLVATGAMVAAGVVTASIGSNGAMATAATARSTAAPPSALALPTMSAAEDAWKREHEDAVRAARAAGATYLPAWLLRDGSLERLGRK